MSLAINDSTTQNYCIDKTAKEGSNLYYATLFETEKNKALIIALHAFLEELTNIINECTDPGVARIKFKWWQDEVERLSNKQPRHPVTRELTNLIIFNSELKSAFNTIIENFEAFLFIEQPDTLQSSLSIFKNTVGELWSQCAILLGVTEKHTLDSIRNTAALYHFIVSLQQADTYLNETRCIIPSSYLLHSELLQLKEERTLNKTAQTKLFTPLLEELSDQLIKTYNSIPKHDRVLIRYSLILNRLAEKTSEEILLDGCHFLQRKVSLTPIRKFWLAWRTNFTIFFKWL